MVFHNTRSLNKHWMHLAADNFMMSADILMLVETRTCRLDVVELPGFQLVVEIGATRRVAGQGSIYTAKYLLKI